MGSKTYINLSEVELGENEYHLLFRGYVSRFCGDRVCEFDFTGNDLRCLNNDLLSGVEKQLKNGLLKSFGYPPFDMKKVSRKFVTHNSFEIDLDKII